MELIGLGVVEVFRANPGPLDEELAEGFPVVRQRLPLVVEDFELKPRHELAGLRLISNQVVFLALESARFAMRRLMVARGEVSVMPQP